MDNYWMKHRARTLTRRRLVAGGGVAATGLVGAALVGCGTSDSKGSGGSTPAPSGQTTPVPKRGGELVMARAGNMAFADPQRSSGGNDPVMVRLYAEKLFRYENGNVTAYLADRLEQPDQASVTIKLRPDIKFGDGTPLNSAAVKFAIQRGADDKLNAPVRPALALIDKVETPDDATVIIKLPRPNALFTSSFAGASVVISPTALQKLGDDGFNKTPVAAGPYTVERIVQDGESTFLRNKDWPLKAPNGDALPYFDKVRNQVIPQAESLVAALLAGDIDLVNVVDLASVKQVKTSSGVTAFEVPGAAWQTVEMTTNAKPTDILALRKAINYALNRDELNQQLAFGLGQPAYESLSPASWVFDKSLPRYSYDPKLAADNLAQAGFPDGLEMKLATYTPIQAEAIQQQLAKVKIKAVIDNLELAVYQDKFRTKGQYPFGTAGGPTEDGEMYTYFLTRYGSKGKYNPGQPNNQEWDDQIAKIETTFEQAERKAIYQQLLRKAYDQAYRAWTLTTPVYYGLRSNVNGVTPLLENHTNPDLRLVWKA